MKSPAKTHAIERLFVPAAAVALPVESAEIARTEGGILYYRWPSPCEKLVGLYVYVNRHEIMLSTKIFHTHVDRNEFEVRSKNPSVRDVPRLIVDQAIIKTLEILRGEKVFIKYYDPAGNEDSSAGMSPLHLWNDPQHRARAIAFHGEGWTARAWDWFGEVMDRL